MIYKLKALNDGCIVIECYLKEDVVNRCVNRWMFNYELYVSRNQMWDCIKVFLKQKLEVSNDS